MTNPGDPATPYLFGDDRPYHERVGDHLNAASYAATGVFGLASLAYEELARREQPINRETVDALTKTLTLVVKRAQGELSGSSSFQHGLNTRLRGALRTVVEVNPLPFGEPTAAWTGWINRAIGHTKSIAKAAHRAYEWDGKGEPWKTLAVDPAPVHVEVDEFAA